MCFKLNATESVQYFQFDSDGNMYVYPPGGGFSGVPKLVISGDELFNESSQDFMIRSKNVVTEKHCQLDVNKLKTSQESSHQIHTYNAPLQKEILDDLSHKNFSPDTMKNVKWVRNMYVNLRNHRNTSGVEQIVCDLEKKETISETDLAYVLCRFIT